VALNFHHLFLRTQEIPESCLIFLHAFLSNLRVFSG
jgi:hypothetical protein